MSRRRDKPWQVAAPLGTREESNRLVPSHTPELARGSVCDELRQSREILICAHNGSFSVGRDWKEVVSAILIQSFMTTFMLTRDAPSSCRPGRVSSAGRVIRRVMDDEEGSVVSSLPVKIPTELLSVSIDDISCSPNPTIKYRLFPSSLKNSSYSA